MTNFRLSSKKYNCGVRGMLLRAGYKFAGKDKMIREDENGRFHAIIQGYKDAMVHYDLFIGWKHSVFSMPVKLTNEVHRICRCNKHRRKLHNKKKYYIVVNGKVIE